VRTTEAEAAAIRAAAAEAGVSFSEWIRRAAVALA